MTAPKLPPLPPRGYGNDGWSEADVLAYGAACTLAERERCAAICERDEFYGSVVPVAIAAAILADPGAPA